MVKLGLFQGNFCVGDIKGNTDKIISAIGRAKARKVNILVFPELALTGYPPEDLLHKRYFIRQNKEALFSIIPATKGIIVIVGFVHSVPGSNRIYNASALLQEGKLVDVYCKMNLPNYGVFDEKRYFQKGTALSSYSFRGKTFSVNICEDVWTKQYVRLLEEKGFDFIINIAASPFHLGKLGAKKDVLSYAARRTGAYVAYCNLVGGQDNLIFDGSSMVLAPRGDVVAFASRFKEDLLEFTFPVKNRRGVKLTEPESEVVFEALCLGIRDYVRKNGFSRVIIGISGGIDSAVAASLAVHALGKENVYGLLMPSRYTSPETLKDARTLCANLGIRHSHINIDSIFSEYLTSLSGSFKGTGSAETEENIQARIRGNILMAFSNKFGYLVLNTGNKSELSCGYCTLYGDLVGGYGVLSDIYKMSVYKLARYINRKKKRRIIPLSVIKRAPTAELREKQKDSDALPPYEILDPILKMYVEDYCSLNEIVASGVRRKLAKKVVSMVDKNEYKRRQAPPGIKISLRAFGKDRRMPITNRFSY